MVKDKFIKEKKYNKSKNKIPFIALIYKEKDNNFLIEIKKDKVKYKGGKKVFEINLDLLIEVGANCRIFDKR